MPADWLFSATYLGNRTLHLEIGEPYNPGIYIPGNCVAGQYGLTAAGACSSTANANYRRLMYLANPSKARNYGALTGFGDGAVASYNGLLVSIQHRFTGNFTVLANETWSHCLTESEVALNGGGFGQSPFNRRAEYGNCLSGRKHAFNLTSAAASPKFQSVWLARLAGGWQQSTIFTAATGSYSTVTVGTDSSRTGGGADRPNIVGDPNLGSPSISRWFATSAFQTPAVGAFGNAGRGIVLVPSAWNFDVALSRSFWATEGHRVDFRAEAFNLFNHARFGNPSTAMNSATSGQVTSARDPRIMQFALKYAF